jgi:hypothetical protein
MKFNEIIEYYTPKLNEDMGRRGRPSAKNRLLVPSEKAFDVGFPRDSVEARIIQFLDATPATSADLAEYLRSNWDEYAAYSACKEKIRQMLIDDILDYANEDEGDEEEMEIPALDPLEDEEPDLHKYVGGALRDYEQSTGFNDFE